MFKIFIENTRAYPVDSTNMEILITNSYFKEKATKKDLAYDAGFIATPELREALGHAQNRQVRITKRTYNATIILGTKSYSASFNLTGFEPNVYVGNFFISEFQIDIYDK